VLGREIYSRNGQEACCVFNCHTGCLEEILTVVAELVSNGTFYEDSCSSSSGASRMVGVVDYVVGYLYEVFSAKWVSDISITYMS
jgi:hypothetical protein